MSVHVYVLLNNCKQNITSLSLLVGTTVNNLKDGLSLELKLIVSKWKVTDIIRKLIISIRICQFPCRVFAVMLCTHRELVRIKHDLGSQPTIRNYFYMTTMHIEWVGRYFHIAQGFHNTNWIPSS